MADQPTFRNIGLRRRCSSRPVCHQPPRPEREGAVVTSTSISSARRTAASPPSGASALLFRVHSNLRNSPQLDARSINSRSSGRPLQGGIAHDRRPDGFFERRGRRIRELVSRPFPPPSDIAPRGHFHAPG
jgi:hypothetical protein